MQVLLLVFLLHVSQHASGVEVSEGAESVRLFCSVSRVPEDSVVVWSRLDLRPSTVHRHRAGEEPNHQNRQFSGRTAMAADAMETGDLSLTLREPRPPDSGFYTCTVHSNKQVLRRTVVQLQVSEPSLFPSWTLVLLAAGLASGVAVYLWFTTITVSRVEVEEGVWSVKLPCRTNVPLPEDAAVEWSRCFPELMRVHENHSGKNCLLRQDEFYCDRTKMEPEPLKTGDLSLTLRDPCCRDSGTYVCTVHKDGDMLAQRAVWLKVKVAREVVDVGEWAQTVTLPFRTSARFPADVTVEWVRCDPPVTVHVYQDGRDQQVCVLRLQVNLTALIPQQTHRKQEVNGEFQVRMQVLLLVFLLHVSQHASGVEVSEGAESVRLFCSVSRVPEDSVVVWSRLDLRPSTVHRHRAGEEPNHQNRQFSGRTAMAADAMETGDLSLTLREPRPPDSGFYTCTVHSNKQVLRRTVVQLQVSEPSLFPSWTLVLLAAGLASGVAVYLWFTTITVSRVEVEEGVWSVKLPCRTNVPLPEDAAVEWSRCFPELMRVHENHSGKNCLLRQDEFYCDRTKMEPEPLKTGDLSLTLRDPCCRDSGTYVCTVHKDGDMLAQRAVWLKVKVAREVVDVGEWAQTVTLPFRTSARFPADVTVEWVRCDPPVTVHVYQDGRDQPERQDELYRGLTRMHGEPLRCRDLSLTIPNAGYGDGGTYVCSVRRDGDVLAQKVVERRFTVSVAKVEVNKPARSVRLPWHITADLPEDATVEWSCWAEKLLKVHVYRGTEQLEEQHRSYRGRTKMRDRPLKSGDLSLTLMNPTHRDGALYIGSVRRQGFTLWDRAVHLQVKGQRGSEDR